MQIDLQAIFSMVPKDEELHSLLGALDATELYEIHVTVKSDGEISQFIEACSLLEVKPLVVQLAGGSVPDDVMTSSEFEGTPSELRDECVRILVGLAAMSWTVVRCKVECAPFHSKVREIQPAQILPSQYFECHIPVAVSTGDDLGALRALCRLYDIHMSANAFKIDQEVQTIMLTYRSSDHCYDSFSKEVLHRVAVIREALYHTTAPIVEFAIFDSKRDHDNVWLSKPVIELDKSIITRMVADRMAALGVS